MVEAQPALGAASTAVKLNLGCAEHYILGWYNVDHEPCPYGRDETVDLTQPLPVSLHGITHVYAGHVLEHLSLSQCGYLLTELRTRMIPGGQIMVVGPDVELAQELGVGPWHNVDEIRAGAKRWPGDEHQWECTAAQVMGLLVGAGWRNVIDVGIAEVDECWPVADRVPQWQLAVSALA